MRIRSLLLKTLLALGLPWITGAGSSTLAESIQPLPRENGKPPFPGKKSNWEGYDRYDFTVDGRECYVVVPPRALPGKPWIWRARFPEWHPEPDLMLLEIGFHVAYMDVAGLYGSPEAVAHFDAFYDFLSRQCGLSPKTTPIGISRGGLAVYNWAKKNPEKVDSIYCESPVCDFKSWPGGKGKGIGSPEDWGGVLKAYGFTEEQALAYRDNPIDNLEALAQARIPILHVIGANDRVVPPVENTYLLQERYKKLGGAMTVHVNTKGPETLDGHHFPLDDPVLVVNFIAKDRPSLRLNEKEGATDPYGRPIPRNQVRLHLGGNPIHGLHAGRLPHAARCSCAGTGGSPLRGSRRQ
jgi:pimeloyl-ACP methyl ester carboxylesterase